MLEDGTAAPTGKDIFILLFNLNVEIATSGKQKQDKLIDFIGEFDDLKII